MLEKEQMLKELNSWAEEAKKGDEKAILFWDEVLPEEITVKEADKFIAENVETYYWLLKSYQKYILKRGENYDE